MTISRVYLFFKHPYAVSTMEASRNKFLLTQGQSGSMGQPWNPIQILFQKSRDFMDVRTPKI